MTTQPTPTIAPRQSEIGNPPPPLPDLDALLKLLEASNLDIDFLCAQLACTPEVLESLLDSEACQARIRLKTKLAHTALKLGVVKLVPKALARMEQLADSEKPEVARRATNTILNLSGIATLSPRPAPFGKTADSPAPSSLEIKNAAEDPRDWRCLELMMAAELNYPHGLPPEQVNPILERPNPDGTPYEIHCCINYD